MHIQSMCQQNKVFTTYMSFEQKEIFIYYVCVYIYIYVPQIGIFTWGASLWNGGAYRNQTLSKEVVLSLEKDPGIYFYYG